MDEPWPNGWGAADGRTLAYWLGCRRWTNPGLRAGVPQTSRCRKFLHLELQRNTLPGLIAVIFYIMRELGCALGAPVLRLAVLPPWSPLAALARYPT